MSMPRNVFDGSSRFLWLASLTVLLVGWTSSNDVRADQEIQPSPYVEWVQWDGWGCSLSWWAKAFGNSNDVADILFTLDGGTLNSTILPGLGMTGVRYNVGACTFEPIGEVAMVESENINPTRQMEGFWLNWFNFDPYSASWDWSVDAHQRSMLLKAKERGVDTFELFSVSPLWWMCYNHNPSGAYDGSDNLQFWNYDAHAIYLATVAEYFRDNYGVQFDYVAPFNEPIAPWWTGDSSQEGCHHDRSTQLEVINFLHAELINRGLTETSVSASDESFYSHATGTWDYFDASTKSKIGKLSVHGYQYENGPREELFFSADGKTLWQSEYGENSADGMRMAKNIHRDFRWLHPEAFFYWQPLDAANWGMINASNNNGTIGSANPKYFVFAQFSRHIRRGMQILESGETDSIVAYDAVNSKLVIVKTNDGPSDNFIYDLSLFSKAEGPVRRWQTNTDGTISYQEFNDISMDNKRLTLSAVANSVNTIEIENVELNEFKNIALGKPTMTDSVGSAGAGGQNAVDGVSVHNHSRWISSDNSPDHWIELDLQGLHAVNELRFWTGENGFNLPINNYSFQFRSGDLWINAVSDSGNIESQVIRPFETVVSDRVRLNIFGATASVKLYEIEVFGSRLGDINLDGQVDLLDVGPFVDLVSSGDYIPEADMNVDGQINLLDVDPFIDVLSGF